MTSAPAAGNRDAEYAEDDRDRAGKREQPLPLDRLAQPYRHHDFEDARDERVGPHQEHEDKDSDARVEHRDQASGKAHYPPQQHGPPTLVGVAVLDCRVNRYAPTQKHPCGKECNQHEQRSAGPEHREYPERQRKNTLQGEHPPGISKQFVHVSLLKTYSSARAMRPRPIVRIPYQSPRSTTRIFTWRSVSPRFTVAVTSLPIPASSSASARSATV